MNRAAFLLLLLISMTTLFFRLGSSALYWDEAIYAQVSKEIIESGDWLTLHWNGRYWFEKPPVYFWATALFYKAFGIGEFWARLPSALSGLGVILLSLLIARLVYNRAAGLLVALILLSSQLFVFYARFGTTDTMLTFFILLSAYGYLRTEGDARFWLLAWASCGMAVMIKGAAGMIAPVALILATLIEGRMSSAVRSRWLWAGISLAVLVVTPWHVLMWSIHGDSFLDSYLWRHVVNRARTNINEYERGYWYYLSVLRDFFSPWVYLVPFGLLFGRTARSGVLVVLAALLIIMYSLVQTKFQWYILPVIPVFAIIVAGFITTTIEKRPRPQIRLAILGVTLLWVAGTSAVVSVIRQTNSDMESGARLAKLAAAERGAIFVYPEELQPTVKFYSGRNLCTDPVLSILSHSRNTECVPGEATHIIFRNTELSKIQSRYIVEPLAEDSGLTYGTLTPKDYLTSFR